MNTRLKLILSTFSRQRSQNDCGIACVLTLCKYAGLAVPETEADGGPMSLLQLRQLAVGAGLQAHCVRMDIEALRSNPWPSILHVNHSEFDHHFIVHYYYESSSGLHLIGDPDRTVCFITEEELMAKWKSGAALFIENIKPHLYFRDLIYPWTGLIEFRVIPKALWLSVPFLTIVATLLGLAVSLVVQKAVEPTFGNGRHRILLTIFFLLLLILMAKCSVNYVKQKLFLNLMGKTGARLTTRIKKNAYRTFRSSNKQPGHLYLKSLADFQTISQAIHLLVGFVFSDFILLSATLLVLYWYQPALIIIQLITLFLMLVAIDHYLPAMLIYYEQGQSTLTNEKTLADAQTDMTHYKAFSRYYMSMNDNIDRKSTSATRLANKVNICLEVISTLNLIIILYILVIKLKFGELSYESFLMPVLICYGMSLLMVKACTQLFPIVHGARRLGANNPGNFL